MEGDQAEILRPPRESPSLALTNPRSHSSWFRALRNHEPRGSRRLRRRKEIWPKHSVSHVNLLPSRYPTRAPRTRGGHRLPTNPLAPPPSSARCGTTSHVAAGDYAGSRRSGRNTPSPT